MIGLNGVMTWSDIQYPERVGKASLQCAPSLIGRQSRDGSFLETSLASFQPGFVTSWMNDRFAARISLPACMGSKTIGVEKTKV